MTTNINPIYADVALSATGEIAIHPNCKAIRLYPALVDDVEDGDNIAVTFNGAANTPALLVFEGQTIQTLGRITSIQVTITGTCTLNVKQLQNIENDFIGQQK